jgi:hypothetical protein
MHLKELFQKYRLDSKVFAEKVKCSRPNVYLLIKGAKPGKMLSQRIERFTEGLVTVTDMRGKDHRRENKVAISLRPKRKPPPCYTQDERTELFEKKIKKIKKMVIEDGRKLTKRQRVANRVRDMQANESHSSRSACCHKVRKVTLSPIRRRTYSNLIKRHGTLSKFEVE